MFWLDEALGPRVRLLDPRPAEAFAAGPILDAVNIPLAELPRRTHELPPRPIPIPVAAIDDAGDAALEWLRSHGRSAFPEPEYVEGLTPRGRLWAPGAFLVECLPHLPPGRALDLGCGSGRDAIALAGLGWNVTAVDRLPDALDKGRELAGRTLGEAADRITWISADFERSEPATFGDFDLALSFFSFCETVVAEIAGCLRPGGSLLVETFSPTHRARHGKPEPARIADSRRLGALLEGLETVRCEEAEGADRHSVRLWARQK